MSNKNLRAITAAAMLGAALASQAQVLTGAVWYTTDSAKRYTGGFANTYGGDTYSRNLYVTANQAVGSGALMNSGNAITAPTRISFGLTAPGTYKFVMYCNDESSLANPFWGLNLFFGDDLSPSISVWNVVNTSGFQVINPVGTPTLDPRTMGLVQSSSGGRSSLTAGGNIVTLTDYKTWSTTHYRVDRVDNFSEVGGLGNGTLDQVIEFTLQVQPVPEPGTLIGLGTLTVGMLARRRARASRI